MKIAVAQISPAKADIAANIEQHKKMLALAVAKQANAIFFPELSLTGYEPALAKSLATTQSDPVFTIFQKISGQHNITIGLGMPTIANTGICISMILLQPNAPTQTYSKQQLHEDELPYFVPGEEQILLHLNNSNIAPAICYESLQASHAANASELGATIYLASVAKSQNGINKAMLHYPAIAKTHNMPVLMSNCVGHCDNFLSVGQTAVWSGKGILLAQMDAQSQGILVFDVETEKVVVAQ
jgi:predicted amidohydrolase